MADNARRLGFRWVMSTSGAAPYPEPRRYRVASGYQAVANPGSVNVSLWPGDPVKQLNDGTVALAAAGDSILGVISGIDRYFDPSIGALNFGNSLPGGTTYSSSDRTSLVHVIPAQNQIFEVVCDDAVTAVTEAAYIGLIGNNADHVFLPSSTDKKANALLDVSTAATATAGWRIIDISQHVQTLGQIDFTGLYVPLYVTCNEVQDAPYVTTGV